MKPKDQSSEEESFNALMKRITAGLQSTKLYLDNANLEKLGYLHLKSYNTENIVGDPAYVIVFGRGESRYIRCEVEQETASEGTLTWTSFYADEELIARAKEGNVPLYGLDT